MCDSQCLNLSIERGKSVNGAEEKRAESEAKKNLMREKAMASMRESAKLFMSSMEDISDSSEDEVSRHFTGCCEEY